MCVLVGLRGLAMPRASHAPDTVSGQSSIPFYQMTLDPSDPDDLPPSIRRVKAV